MINLSLHIQNDSRIFENEKRKRELCYSLRVQTRYTIKQYLIQDVQMMGIIDGLQCLLSTFTSLPFQQNS